MQTDTLVNLYLDEHIRIAHAFPVGDVCLLLGKVEETYSREGRVFIFGNGGGASIAEHFASDLSIHPFVSEDKHASREYFLQVHCLNNSNGLITRIGNDMGYEKVFTEQLGSHGLEGNDLVIALSGSGNSPNILDALSYARKCEAMTVLIGGRDGGKAKDLVDICILIPGSSKFPGQVGANDNCFHIEDFQGMIAHMVTGLLKEAING